MSARLTDTAAALALRDLQQAIGAAQEAGRPLVAFSVAAGPALAHAAARLEGHVAAVAVGSGPGDAGVMLTDPRDRRRKRQGEPEGAPLTDADLRAWADRHDLQGSPTDLRAMVSDAASLHLAERAS